MTKADFVAKVAEKANITKTDAERAVNAVVENITEIVAAGDKITLNGLGTFDTIDVKERTGIIRMGARTGETYVTPAHKAPRFKAAKALKDAAK